MTSCVVQRVCSDCGRHHCSKCVLKCASNELRCRPCDRLASGVVPRNELMRYRVKDLRRFLAKRHIPTEHCTEKTDLVELILRSTNGEQFDEQQELQRQRIQELQVTHSVTHRCLCGRCHLSTQENGSEKVPDAIQSVFVVQISE